MFLKYILSALKDRLEPDTGLVKTPLNLIILLLLLFACLLTFIAIATVCMWILIKEHYQLTLVEAGLVTGGIFLLYSLAIIFYIRFLIKKSQESNFIAKEYKAVKNILSAFIAGLQHKTK